MSEETTNEEDELELHEYKDDDAVILKTHEEVNRSLSGEITKLEVGYAEVRLRTTPDMLADNQGLIHGGFIFSAADFAAMAAINEKNVVLVASDCQFLSPVKLHDEVDIVATVRHKNGRKRNVHVKGFVLDIKVFEGEFKTVITERHILKLKLLEEEGKENKKTRGKK
jgi:acyl-CoA thioesterase